MTSESTACSCQWWRGWGTSWADLKATRVSCQVLISQSTSPQSSHPWCLWWVSTPRETHWACSHSDVQFGYSGQPMLFNDLNFGISMESRGEHWSHCTTPSILCVQWLLLVLMVSASQPSSIFSLDGSIQWVVISYLSCDCHVIFFSSMERFAGTTDW